MTLVLGVSGRRVDVGSASRFPIENVALVYRRIHAYFAALEPKSIVASAACGADLLALKACNELQIRYRVVLPFSPPIFRATSVVDRPGDWGPLFDEFTSNAAARSELIILDLGEKDSTAYDKTNHAILRNVLGLAGEMANSEALIVWDGRSYGNQDTTAGFRLIAKQMGMKTTEILTQ